MPGTSAGERDWRFIAESGEEFTAEAVSSIILKRLKEDAEDHLGRPVEGAAITVPAYFNDAQRTATMDAAKLAGLNVLRILNEPTAAALAYGVKPGAESGTIAVYDLGGGTFDVTIMRVAPNEIEVLATGGDKNLGGFDWDNALMNLLAEKFEEGAEIPYPDDPAAQQDLRDKAEIAKKTLSNRDRTKVFLATAGKQHTVDLTRESFEATTAHLLKRTSDILEMVLDDAKLTWPAIDKVLLVGGSTRMPMVGAQLLKTCGQEASTEMHPDEVVALGAAIQAGDCWREQGASPGTSIAPPRKISDVASHSLGVVIYNGDERRRENSIIIPRNTPIPTSIAEKYGTIQDQQREIAVQVTEGEESDLEFVRILGRAEIEIPPYPSGAPIEITFSYDANGILQIAVKDLTSGKPLHQFEIRRDANRPDSELAAIRDQIDRLSIQ